MIDWGSLAANSLWILGCALALAVFSYASWLAACSGNTLSAHLQRSHTQAGFSLAGIFFCAGLSLTVDSGLMRIIWVVLGGLFLIKLFAHTPSAGLADQSGQDS